MTSTSSQRPQTSRPRGVCSYFNSPRGCLNGQMCKFLHGAEQTMSPYDTNKVCRFYSAGYCKRGDNCWFRHLSFTPPAFPTTNASSAPSDSPASNPVLAASDSEDDDNMCCICQEKPTTYGLLIGCSHICCLQCIRGWRDRIGKPVDILESGNTKKCPYCRTPSHFVTPSSFFYSSGDPRKEVVIAKYKASMARTPCKYFERSAQRHCPFGRDCFYQHKNRDGTHHVFPFGADYYLERSRQHRRNVYSGVDYESAAPGLGRALEALRQRLLAFQSSSDEDSGAFGLLEDILTSFGSNPPDDPLSYSTALRVMSNIFDEADEDDEDESIEDDEDDELPPPLEPFARPQATSERTNTPSPLPLTRSYMTSVSTDQDPEPRPIVVNDPDDFGGVAVTTTVHVHHDDVAVSSNAIDGEVLGPYVPVGADVYGMRTASGTNLSSLLHHNSADSEIYPDHPRRPRSALLSYATEHHNSFAPSAVGSHLVQQQQSVPTSPPPLEPVLRSPIIASTSRASLNCHSDDEGRSQLSLNPPNDIPATAAVRSSSAASAPPQPSVPSDSVPVAVDANPSAASASSSSSARKESRRKSERERRSFVTDGRGRVVATADSESDAAPSLFWTQPPTVIETSVVEERGAANLSNTNSVATLDSAEGDSAPS
ncbi:hypothetical protein SCHPADRAFT_399908 [Schizopora paradoxa]|uniref:RING-type E3 ubiquitin transferase n=1 Tax=Schizopora paradoxa TaxID=27342 RepID=A0A0H2RMC5_9AGAM|nr:hypothetical protein SCHPADRAFT_399908 [Schizopora paradoxa]